MNIGEFVAGLSPPMFTTSQAAEQIGRSTDTLRRWRETDPPILNPSEQRQFGNLTVVLYTRKDIERGKQIAATLRPGRKSQK